MSYHTMVCPACAHCWFHRGCIQVGALPSPCRHAWRSAAPGPAHAPTACASPAATGLECWRLVLPVPQLSGHPPVLSRDVPHGDPYPTQVGVHLPSPTGIKAAVLGLPRDCLGRPGPWLSQEHVPQLHGGAGNGAGADVLGSPWILCWGHWGLITSPPFSCRRPLWEESDAYESLLERHSRCNACECLYRGGREQAEREG